MLTGNEIRDKFLQFFAQRDHTVVSSSSLVPHDDPTLLFTNAGMNQFKDVFLGLDGRSYSRATSSQKCVRAGGKHNDLDTVGKTARHHTFFEMLGNFSFGDYFKKEAIEYAWGFLVQELQIDPERLWITVFTDDDEAEALWKAHTSANPDKIVRLGEKDNFWSMGDVGPCGPCSEIIYDRGPTYACQEPVCAIGGCDCDRWLEVWNLVFMQYDRDSQGIMHPLPKPSIDTGMGLERITSVIQMKDSNYDTDLLRPLIAVVEEISGQHYTPDDKGFAFRVIADHARSTTFLINDGVIPSNEGRGYVLRRILRRAVRFGKVLGIREPFLYRMVAEVARLMEGAYPDIRTNQEFLTKVIRMEEERFHETLEAGMKVASDIVEKTLAGGQRVISGEDAFVLYDTYGFPLDLTEDIAEEKEMTVDGAGFHKSMEKQKERARGARSQEDAFENAGALAQLFTGLAATEFCGYETMETESRILLLASADVARKELMVAGDRGVLVLDRTPFYGESGGQIGDTGRIYSEGKPVFKVLDTQKAADGRIYHRVEALDQVIIGQKVNARVTESRRIDIARNHSATHLLHAALQEVVGPYANQKGSLVETERLRFDFSHFAPLTREELNEIEKRVNEAIWENLPVESREMDIEEAQEKGATALFGEKYGERVRVVTMGSQSMELCGGTHVGQTGAIGLFRILGESGIGSGLRRIEAVTGRRALEMMKEDQQKLSLLGHILKAKPSELEQKAGNLMEQLRQRDEEINRLTAKLTKAQSGSLLEGIVDIGGVKFLSARVDVADMDTLRQTGDMLKDRMGEGVVLLGMTVEDKVNFVVMATPEAVARGAHAGNLIKEVARIAGGGGGGKPQMAQAGGKNPEKLEEALQKAASILEKQIH